MLLGITRAAAASRAVQAARRHFGRGSNDRVGPREHNWGMSWTAPELQAPRGLGALPALGGKPVAGPWEAPRSAPPASSFEEGAAAGPHATEHHRRLRPTIEAPGLGA